MPSLMRSLIVDNDFFVIFEMEAKLSMGLDAVPTSHAPKPKKQEVVDELLVLSHAKFL